MLCLSRKVDEKIVCRFPDGREITFTLLQIRGDKVRLGIDAANDVDIMRGELVPHWNKHRAAQRVERAAEKRPA